MTAGLTLGAVAYDPKVVTIWSGFRSWFRDHEVSLDFVLYSNYERQVEDLVAGRIGLAWNSPLAWVRARRMAQAASLRLRPVAMRDTDCGLTSVVVVRSASSVHAPADLRGRLVATGALDSPQATLLPLALMRSLGLRPGNGGDTQVRRFDVGVGLHGDHVGGERAAAQALAAGKVDAACMLDSNLLLFAREGILPPDSTRVVARTPPYDHCTLTAGPIADDRQIARLGELLHGMSYADPELRPLLDLEGLKAWLPPRLEGYQQLEQAVDDAGFYDREGKICAAGYRP